MKTLFTVVFVLALFGSAYAQQAKERIDSVVVNVQFGSANKELNQLMSRVMHIEKLHFEVHNQSLAGKHFHMTYQE